MSYCGEIPGHYYGKPRTVAQCHLYCTAMRCYAPNLANTSIKKTLDEEKKKYFAIMPDHLAPAGATYSQTAVDKRKEEQKVS